jgi:flagellar biosynthesis/type III secretory pathway protein FliH
MGEIIIKIPRHKSHVKIIRSERAFEQQIKEHKFKDLSYNKAKEAAKAIVENDELNSPKIPAKSVFIEKFTFSESNQPISISLNNINRELITLDEAKVEVQNAYDKGFQDGQESSTAAYEKELNEHRTWIKSVHTILEKMRSEFSDEILLLEKSSVKVAIIITEHLIQREIERDNNIIFQLVRKAINSIDEESIMKLSVNPEDYEIINSQRPKLFNDKTLGRTVEISSDEEVDRGGCILHTDAGIVDARISTQLESIRMVIEEETDKESGIDEFFE